MNITKNKKILTITILPIGILVLILILYKLTSKSYLQELSYQEYQNKITNKETFAITITRKECSHCVSFKPKLASIGKKYQTYLYYLDTDKLTKEEKQKIDIDGTPTTIIYQKGQEASKATRIVGNQKQEQVTKILKENNIIQ